MRSRWLLPALLIVAALVASFAFGLDRSLNFESIKAQQGAFEAYKAAHPLLAVAGFVVAYVAIGVLPIPLAVILTLLAGALFGLIGGFLVASFAAAFGAGVGFVVSRYLLRERIAARFTEQTRRIDEGIARDGLLFLFTLRLLPVLPFFLVNLLFGVSAMSLRRFYAVSQIGMAPGALVYVNAGRQLSKLDSVHGIVSPGLVGSFALLALFPWIARALSQMLRRRRSRA